jgi:hypothetical protein
LPVLIISVNYTAKVTSIAKKCFNCTPATGVWLIIFLFRKPFTAVSAS